MMKINKHFVNRIFGALLCLFIFTCASVDSIAVPAPTKFDVVPDWPKQLPNNWIMGQVAGVDVDSKDNIWIVQRPNSLTPQEAGLAQDPPLDDCCLPAPSVLAFDQQGNLLTWFGGKNFSGQWPQTEHGLFIDHEDNIWIAGAGNTDDVVLKLSNKGELLLQVGEYGVYGGSNDIQHLGKPTDIAVDAENNEAYISDGYRNRRIIVVDATTGEYKRHWGAYGSVPHDRPLPDYSSLAPPDSSFRSPVHAIRLSNDGHVYIADRVNNRIQVFQKDGTFIKEAFIAPKTLDMGSVWDIELSRDPQQSMLYVADGMNNRIWILNRHNLDVSDSLGRPGRYAGQFGWIHNVAMDSKGNLYTTEVETGKRVQKFRPQ